MFPSDFLELFLDFWKQFAILQILDFVVYRNLEKTSRKHWKTLENSSPQLHSIMNVGNNFSQKRPYEQHYILCSMHLLSKNYIVGTVEPRLYHTFGRRTIVSAVQNLY